MLKAKYKLHRFINIAFYLIVFAIGFYVGKFTNIDFKTISSKLFFENVYALEESNLTYININSQTDLDSEEENADTFLLFTINGNEYYLSNILNKISQSDIDTSQYNLILYGQRLEFGSNITGSGIAGGSKYSQVGSIVLFNENSFDNFFTDRSSYTSTQDRRFSFHSSNKDFYSITFYIKRIGNTTNYEDNLYYNTQYAPYYNSRVDDSTSNSNSQYDILTTDILPIKSNFNYLNGYTNGATTPYYNDIGSIPVYFNPTFNGVNHENNNNLTNFNIEELATNYEYVYYKNKIKLDIKQPTIKVNFNNDSTLIKSGVCQPQNFVSVDDSSQQCLITIKEDLDFNTIQIIGLKNGIYGLSPIKSMSNTNNYLFKYRIFFSNENNLFQDYSKATVQHLTINYTDGTSSILEPVDKNFRNYNSGDSYLNSYSVLNVYFNSDRIQNGKIIKDYDLLLSYSGNLSHYISSFDNYITPTIITGDPVEKLQDSIKDDQQTNLQQYITNNSSNGSNLIYNALLGADLEDLNSRFISDFILLPYEFLNFLSTNLNNNTCINYVIPFSFLDSNYNLTFKCLDLESKLFGETWWHIIDLLFSFFMFYNIVMLLINKFNTFTHLEDDYDSIYAASDAYGRIHSYKHKGGE